jgi:hypothetical protein
MSNYWTATGNYLVAAAATTIQKWDGANWTRIATGGVKDNTNIKIAKFGQINNAGGYEGLTIELRRAVRRVAFSSWLAVS